MAGLFLQQSQVGRSENRQDNSLGGGHTAGTPGFRLLGQEVKFSICKDRGDPPKFYKKEMEKQQQAARPQPAKETPGTDAGIPVAEGHATSSEKTVEKV